MRGIRPWLVIWLLMACGCAGPAASTGPGLRQQAVSFNDAGYQSYEEGNRRLAQRNFEEALKLNRLIDHQAGIGANLNNLGVIHQQQGDLDKALAFFKEALSIHQGLGDPAGLAETLNNLGTVYEAQARLKEAEETYQQALTWARGLPPGPLLALTLTHMGDVARARGDYQAALGLYRQALEIDAAGKDLKGQARRRERLGRAYLGMKDYPAAGQNFNAALEEFRRLENTNGIIDALDGLTRLALAQGDREGALNYGTRLIKIYQALGRDQEATKLEARLKIEGRGQGPPAR